LDDRPPDGFDDLRDDGVPESPKSVQPRGNPINHSTHVGFSFPPAIAFASSGVVAFASIALPAVPEFMALLL
jgi:hypothetical protein